jgi:vesicle coat complex subunit
MRWAFALTALMGLAWPMPASPLPEPPHKDQELVANLVEMLDDGDPEVRQNIATSLANLGDTAVPALIEALNHSQPERRMGAARALGLVRPAARSAIPALTRTMKDKNLQVRREVSYALSRIVGVDPQSVATPARLPNVPPPEPPSANGATP